MHETVHIVTNVREAERAAALRKVQLTRMDPRLSRFIRQCLAADIVVVDNSDQPKLYLACLLRALSRFRLVSVDIVLRRPSGVRSRLTCLIKRLLLKQVDRFILYFRNTTGFDRYYGIGPARTIYVPFKVNGLDERALPSGVADGDYVLCAGRTMRDLATFVAAMRSAGCPGLLLQQSEKFLRAHGTRQYQDELPANVRLQIDPGDQLAAFIQVIAGARIVVLPRYRNDIGCTGISTYLMAMAMNKCVIVSKGPGAEDVLPEGTAVFVEPQDPQALAEAIRRLWNDDKARRAIAAAGKSYAEGCGGTARLANDIMAKSLALLEADARR